MIGKSNGKLSKVCWPFARSSYNGKLGNQEKEIAELGMQFKSAFTSMTEENKIEIENLYGALLKNLKKTHVEQDEMLRAHNQSKSIGAAPIK